MDEVTAVLNSEQIDVWAPPATIQLVVGIGAQGQRGSKLYAGDPPPATFFASYGEAPIIGDMYLAKVDQRMWQLVASPTGAEWSVMFDINEISGGA